MQAPPTPRPVDKGAKPTGLGRVSRAGGARLEIHSCADLTHTRARRSARGVSNQHDPVTNCCQATLRTMFFLRSPAHSREPSRAGRVLVAHRISLAFSTR